MVTSAPDRGDIVWVNFSPQKGHEQAGVRPALVLSPRAYNTKSGLVLVCPITSKVKGYPFEVRIQTDKIDGVVLADQVKSLDWRARKVTVAGEASGRVISRVQDLAAALLLN